jgi:Amidase
MKKTRRTFLKNSAAGLGGLAAGAVGLSATGQESAPAPAGSPPAFGTGTAMGPEVSVNTFVEAEKLVQFEMSAAQRTQAATSWRGNLSALYERRTGPRKVDLPPSVTPYSTWDPRIPGAYQGPTLSRFARSPSDPGPVPKEDAAIAFAPVTQLSRWIETRQLSSERLTKIYLERLERYNKTLRCVITLTADRALAAARRADQEIAAGHYRGPLHGIPWGAKDLLDTANIPTTYGAEPYRDRRPVTDAAVVQRLDAAGAVLVAKLSLGALALNDIWFGGQTMNPWVLEEGASGSSAGPGSATAAGLVGFSIGSQTGGSIVAPSMRCGVTGLRPTYGRVPRSGAMTLCWSLDKLGPMTRSVEDAYLVLAAIHGADSGDLQSITAPFEFDAIAPVRGLRVGYIPRWMNEEPATEVDRASLEALRALGLETLEGLAIRFVKHHSVCGECRRLRGTHAVQSRGSTARADLRCVAKPLPTITVPFCG